MSADRSTSESGVGARCSPAFDAFEDVCVGHEPSVRENAPETQPAAEDEHEYPFSQAQAVLPRGLIQEDGTQLLRGGLDI